MSEAERLAEYLHRQFMNDETNFDTMIEASIELRRLSAELDALKAAIGEQVEDNWRKYATEREETAQAVIERYRNEHDSLLRLLAKDRKRIAELERELEKEKQYVKEMTKDRDHWMTVAAERALLPDKNRKVNKPLSDYEFDEIG